MNWKKIFSPNHLLCAASILGTVGTTITACRATKKNKKWTGYILPSLLFAGTCTADVLLTIRGDKAEAKALALAATVTALVAEINNERCAVENVYGEEGVRAVDREKAAMKGNKIPENTSNKDVCYLGYGIDDYVLMDDDDLDVIEKEMNRRLRCDGSTSIADFVDILSELNGTEYPEVSAMAMSYGWDRTMLPAMRWLTIETEGPFYDGGDIPMYYINFDMPPQLGYRIETEIAPWE